MRQRFIYSVFIWIIALTIVQASPAGKVPAKYSALISKAFKNAGPNKVQLQKALRLAPSSQTEGVAFLIAYMPVRDLRSLKADFILENTALAYKARETFPWAKAIPDSIFLNDVLPYVSLNETRENWRKDFFERFSSRVKGCTTLAQAIDSVNKNINKVVQVEYN
ncbi:MAG: transglutaminase domain-containing protein, partial [Bacteroidota bacterium]|nr:transglutaminase domain-containing protein [Bacteroidota bacterium]